MIARATGAFVLAFFGLVALLGQTETGPELVVLVLVAAAIAAAVAYWSRPGERTAEAGEAFFDERATRRAVRRGVLRTGLMAVVWVIAGWVVLYGVASAWQTRGDRPERFREVALYGFQAANPGVRPPVSASCCNTNLRTIELILDAEMRTADPIVERARVELELNWRGRLKDGGFVDLPRSGVDAARMGGAASRGRLETVLRRLPEPLVMTAVVSLRRPLALPVFYAVLTRIGIVFPDSSAVGVFLEPDSGGSDAGRRADERVSWPSPNLAGFQTWVKTLRGSDNRLLDDLGLPDRKRLRELAARPRIHGFVLDRATPAQLRQLIAESAVSNLEIGDAAFDLGAYR